MANNLYVYAMNLRDIYTKVEWLMNNLVKKAVKGVELDANQLAECSTMKAIISAAVKYGCCKIRC